MPPGGARNTACLVPFVKLLLLVSTYPILLNLHLSFLSHMTV